MQAIQKPLFGIYIHWPFCLSKCPYCDFYSQTDKMVDYNMLMMSYQRDILFFKSKMKTVPIVTSVFLGGGTPSLMPIDFFEELMRFLKKEFLFAPDIEISLEANPDAIDSQKMLLFQKNGVNRLSIGVQALNDSDLKLLGRRHTLETALSRIKDAKSIFDNVNMDLIYARPNQSISGWEEELNRALDLNLSHYSLYQLTIEENTPFGRQNICTPDEDTAVELYLKTHEIMTQRGKPAYEISNYADIHHQCQHNLTYWLGGDYLGLGPASHGRIGLLATQNPRSVKQWFKEEPICEVLTDTERKTEKIIMGLRLFDKGFPLGLLNLDGVQQAISWGWGVCEDNLFYPTINGHLLLNQLVELVAPND